MSNERYSRQILLGNFGAPAQQKLLQAKVLVVGAGGLGCPVLQYLAAAGTGTIGIADADVVSLSNLQRQVLYTTSDIGRGKVSVAAARLRQMNPEITIQEHPVFVDNQNALTLFAAYDYIIDGTDNFAARYLINDACVLLGKPLIFGAVYQYEGQVAVFNVADSNGTAVHYRHLFPTPPSENEAPDCATGGVIGTLPGIIGILQATEAIKLITGIGHPLCNRLLTWNALTNDSLIIDLSAAEEVTSAMPQTPAEYAAMDYPAFCGQQTEIAEQVGAAAFRRLVEDERIAIIDVREPGEQPPAAFRHKQIPLSVFKERMHEIQGREVALFCRSGVRSLTAAELLAAHPGRPLKIYNLRGGILSL